MFTEQFTIVEKNINTTLNRFDTYLSFYLFLTSYLLDSLILSPWQQTKDMCCRWHPSRQSNLLILSKSFCNHSIQFDKLGCWDVLPWQYIKKKWGFRNNRFLIWRDLYTWLRVCKQWVGEDNQYEYGSMQKEITNVLSRQENWLRRLYVRYNSMCYCVMWAYQSNYQSRQSPNCPPTKGGG